MRMQDATKYGTIMLWYKCMKTLRIAPRAQARSLLTRLDSYANLSPTEERTARLALENCGVPDVVNRFIAQNSKGAIRKLLESI